MAFKIIWSSQARDDLRDIVRYIARNDQTAAESFACRLMAKADALGQFPLMGRVVSEADDRTIREIVVRPYRVIYRYLEEERAVAIVRLWHGARGEPEIQGRPND